MSLLPKRVTTQYDLTPGEWTHHILRSWAKQRGETKLDSCMDFLNIAQDLDMFGITYFEITNKKGTRLWLGVHNRGMDVYKSTNK